MTTSHDQPVSVRRVLADLHVDALTDRQRDEPEQRAYVTLVPPQGGRLDVIRTHHRKWWLEGRYREQEIRLPLTLQQAAEIAACAYVETWVVHHEGVPGGERFDRLVAQINSEA